VQTLGALNTAPMFHTAMLLAKGKVLVAASYNNGPVSSAELYNPSSGTWTVTGAR
jgi:hypothetical protein